MVRLAEIEIGNNVRLDPFRKVLAPLGASNQPILREVSVPLFFCAFLKANLFSIPAGKHNSPQRFPSAFQQFTKAAYGFMKRRSSGGRVGSTQYLSSVSANHGFMVQSAHPSWEENGDSQQKADISDPDVTNHLYDSPIRQLRQ